jgi:hypothetical protein
MTWLELVAARPRSLDYPAIVSSGRGDETILTGDETVLPFGADIRKRRMVIN